MYIQPWDFLPALGIDPVLGRGFTSGEERVGTRVLLISHSLWTSRFASDKSILDRQIKLNGNLYSVIGVMPPSFRFPINAPRNDFWTTLAVDDDPTDPEPNTLSRGSHFLSIFGRMKPGVTVEQVDQDLKTIAANLAKEYPNTNTRHDTARTRTAIAALLGNTRPALMARINWPGQDPLGKHIKLGAVDGTEPERTVVGVVRDVRTSGFEDQPQPTTYVPFAQQPQWSSAIVVRTSATPSTLASAVVARVRSIDSDEPPYDVRTLEQVISDNVSGVESSARMPANKSAASKSYSTPKRWTRSSPTR